MFSTTDFQSFRQALEAAAVSAAEASEEIRNLGNEMAASYAVRVIQGMIARTRSGIDADGNQFTRYSPGYQRATGKITVDLTVMGDLLDSIVYLPAGEGFGSITFKAGNHYSGLSFKELAGAHQHGKGHLPSRQFFGWRGNTPEDLRLKLMTIEEFRQQIRKLFD